MNTTTSLTQGRFVIPEVVASHFHIREGDTVADFGAGSGFFAEVLSRLVGQTGKVVACEIQKELVEKIGTLARSKGLHNIDVVWCDLEAQGKLKVPQESLDVAILVNTLFQLEEKQTAIQEMAGALRSGGKFFVIDWSESFGGLGPQVGQVVTADTAKALFEANGFVFERDFDAGDHHYGLAFRKV